MIPQPNDISRINEKQFNYGKICDILKKYWWVFLSSVVIFLGLGLLFLHIKNKNYEVRAAIILNQDHEQSGSLGGTLGALMSTFSLGGGGSKVVEDENLRIQSQTNMTEVVSRLGLDKNYYSKKGLFDPKTWYYNNSPIEVDAPEGTFPTTIFKMDVPAGAKGIEVKVKQGKEFKEKLTFQSFPFTVKTPRGNFTVRLTDKYNAAESLNFGAIIMTPGIRALDLREKVFFVPSSKKSNIITIKTEDNIPQRSKDLINTAVEVYRERVDAENRDQAIQTVKFIDQRLNELYTQLEANESEIEAYKRAHDLVDAEAEAQYIFLKKGTIEGALIESQTKLGVTQMILDFLRNEENKYALVPFSQNISDDPISDYNEIVLQRIQLMANPKGNAPAIRTIDSQIDAMRANVISSLEREVSALKITSHDLGRESGKTESRMREVPTMERELLGLYRNSKIQNTIYAFLIQKREEAQIQALRNNRTCILYEEPYDLPEPSSPNTLLVLAIAFIAGILCPAGGFWVLAKLGKLKY